MFVKIAKIKKMGNLNDAQKNPKQVAEQLGVRLVDPQTPKATGVCSQCGTTLYNGQPCPKCSGKQKKEWI